MPDSVTAAPCAGRIGQQGQARRAGALFLRGEPHPHLTGGTGRHRRLAAIIDHAVAAICAASTTLDTTSGADPSSATVSVCSALTVPCGLGGETYAGRALTDRRDGAGDRHLRGRAGRRLPAHVRGIRRDESPPAAATAAATHKLDLAAAAPAADTAAVAATAATAIAATADALGARASTATGAAEAKRARSTTSATPTPPGATCQARRRGRCRAVPACAGAPPEPAPPPAPPSAPLWGLRHRHATAARDDEQR